MNLEEFIKHARDRSYMGNIERDKQRVKSTGEVFTPTKLVQEILDKVSIEQFTDKENKVLDPTCGDGQFLSEVMIRKMENGSTYDQAKLTTYGADLMEDNCIECIRRLWGKGTITTIKAIEYNEETFEITQQFDPDFPDNFVTEGIKAVFTFNGKIVPTIVQADGLIYNYDFGEQFGIYANKVEFTKDIKNKHLTYNHNQETKQRCDVISKRIMDHIDNVTDSDLFE